ncbi:hypothetical protein [Frankia sp. CiP3]|uniref:hypothetical protein n=1 Tax=Frankia sp. CiP3 TaxID=2880971 RepID=UPI001EF6D0A8|nr:hypothetical protein [Frankia sp. CiP3]
MGHVCPDHICPECDEEVISEPPTDDLTPYAAHGLTAPAWAHLDGTPLCPVIGPDGYQPAQPKRRRRR